MKIGLRPEMIKWIMACVENVNYAININGVPSSYFLAERGLRQGCPLAPILFILAMNTLSLHINKVVNENICRPIKISRYISISHNLFVDDVLLCVCYVRTHGVAYSTFLLNSKKPRDLSSTSPNPLFTIMEQI